MHVRVCVCLHMCETSWNVAMPAILSTLRLKGFPSTMPHIRSLSYFTRVIHPSSFFPPSFYPLSHKTSSNHSSLRFCSGWVKKTWKHAIGHNQLPPTYSHASLYQVHSYETYIASTYVFIHSFHKDFYNIGYVALYSSVMIIIRGSGL